MNSEDEFGEASPGDDSARQADNVLHVLFRGLPLCGRFKSVPAQWPSGHKWVSLTDRERATCAECRARCERRQEQNARRESMRERYEQAHAALVDELAKAGHLPAGTKAELREVRLDLPTPEIPTPLSVAGRYKIFVEAVRATVREQAPEAIAVVDRIGYVNADDDDIDVGPDCLVAISLGGAEVSTRVHHALASPQTAGRDVAERLLRILEAQIGRKIARGD